MIVHLKSSTEIRCQKYQVLGDGWVKMVSHNILFLFLVKSSDGSSALSVLGDWKSIFMYRAG